MKTSLELVDQLLEDPAEGFRSFQGLNDHAQTDLLYHFARMLKANVPPYKRRDPEVRASKSDLTNVSVTRSLLHLSLRERLRLAVTGQLSIKSSFHSHRDFGQHVHDTTMEALGVRKWVKQQLELER